MRIYVICPVRAAEPAVLDAVAAHVAALEAEGHEVHFPPRDVDQDDPTGAAIVGGHLAAMRAADRVDVFWDKASSGSHFDLGMAAALDKPVRVVRLLQDDGPGKSYAKVMTLMDGRDLARFSDRLPFGRIGRPLERGISLSR